MSMDTSKVVVIPRFITETFPSNDATDSFSRDYHFISSVCTSWSVFVLFLSNVDTALGLKSLFLVCCHLIKRMRDL